MPWRLLDERVALGGKLLVGRALFATWLFASACGGGTDSSARTHDAGADTTDAAESTDARADAEGAGEDADADAEATDAEATDAEATDAEATDATTGEAATRAPDWQFTSVNLVRAQRSEPVAIHFETPVEAFAVRAAFAADTIDPNLCVTLEDVVVNGSERWIAEASVDDYAEFCVHCSERVSVGADYGLFMLPSGLNVTLPITDVKLRVSLRECDSLLPWPKDRTLPTALRVEWTASVPPAAAERVTLDVAVAVASARGFPQGLEDPQLRDALSFMQSVWSAAGIDLRVRAPVALQPPPQAPSFAPDHRGALNSLAESARATLSVAPGAALIVLSPCLTQADPLTGSPRPLGGLTPHLPGGFGLHGEADGIFAAVETCGGLEPQPRFLSAAALGALLAHELGHFLGLYHVLESDGTQDMFADTDGSAANLMRTMPSAEAIALSPSQISAARRHLSFSHPFQRASSP